MSKPATKPTLSDFERVLGIGDGALEECIESRRVLTAAGHDVDDADAVREAYTAAIFNSF